MNTQRSIRIVETTVTVIALAFCLGATYKALAALDPALAAPAATATLAKSAAAGARKS